MDRVKGLLKQLRAVLRPGAAERQMREELRFHLDQEIDRHRRQGATPAQARRLAMTEFGPMEAVKEELRGAGVRGVLAGAGRDVRQAVRGLRRRPGFAVSITLTLGLGIGVSTAMYSLVHAVVVRPLPYENADRLISVWETYPGWRGRPVLGELWDRIGLAWPDYQAWRARQTAFEDVAVFAVAQMTTSGGAPPEVVQVGRASGSLWPLLGAAPRAGRLFAEPEAGEGAEPIAVLSHALWQRRFGGHRSTIGAALQLNGRPFTIAGVLPAGFGFGAEEGRPIDVWIPAGAAGMPMGPDNHSFAAVGRLRSDTSLATAAAEAEALFLGERRPGSVGAALVPYADQVVGSSRQPLLILLAGTLVLLLIACVNVAALIAGDTAGREREIATRRALGASRGVLIRQFVLETLALSMAAAAVGIGAAAVVVPSLVALAPPDLPRIDEVSIDAGVLGYALGAAVLTTLICSAVATLVAERLGRSAAPRASSRVTSGGRYLQPAFVAVQVALLMVLGTAGLLLGRSLLTIRAVDPGFHASDMLTAAIEAPGSHFATRGELTGFYRRLTESFEAIPGVVAVTGVSVAPFADGSESTSVGIEGLPDGGRKPEMERRVVLPGYFETMRIPVLRGTTDLFGDVPRVVVSETMAARLWPGQSPIGRRISLRDDWYDVVGLVADVRDQALSHQPEGTYYVSLQAAREDTPRMRMLIRTDVRAETVADDVRRALAGVDPSIPIGEIASMDSLVSRSLSAERYRALLVNVFAGASLGLAAVGIFGVTLRVLLRRRRELGVRLALGASPGGLAARVLALTAAGSAAGLGVGAVASALFAPALAAYLYDLPARDTATYIASAGLLLIVSLAAAAIPIVRTARMNVVEALRES